MKNIKLIMTIIGLALTVTAIGAGTGNFAVSNANFKELINDYRFASPKNIPWAGSYWTISYEY